MKGYVLLGNASKCYARFGAALYCLATHCVEKQGLVCQFIAAMLCRAVRCGAVLGNARIGLLIYSNAVLYGNAMLGSAVKCLEWQGLVNQFSAGQSTVWPCDVVFGTAMRRDALRGKDCLSI